MVADDNYQIGVGDKINVSIWGSSSFNKESVVDELGFVSYGNLVKVNLKGKTVSEAREIMISKFRAFANLSSSSFQITVVGVRKINVNVVGEVYNPGTYNIFASNSVFSLLSKIGGPTDLGSVRNIYIKREGKIIDSFDVYEFMFSPKGSREIYLQNNDYVIISPIAKSNIVKIDGAINKSGVYEMKKGENINDLIIFAAGLKVKSFTKDISVKRYSNSTTEMISLNLDSLNKSKAIFLIKNGDEILIRQFNENNFDIVKLRGAVNITGDYSFIENESISDLLKRANGILDTTSLEYSYIVRTENNQRKIIIPFKLSEVLKNNPQHNLILMKRDSVFILAQKNIFTDYTVTINGAVNYPNTFKHGKGLKLLDYLNMCQGLSTTAIKEYAIYKKTNEYGVSTQRFIDIQNVMSNPSSNDNFELEPRDELFIFDKVENLNDFNVRIDGEVKKPSKYKYSSGMTLHQLIALGGYFTFESEETKIEIIRNFEIDNNGEFKHGKVQLFNLGVLKKIEFENLSNSFVLFPGDVVFVRRNPYSKPLRFVTIEGEVKYPGTYALINDNEKISDVIKRAGGLNEGAFLHGTKFYRSSIFDNNINFKDSQNRVVINLNKALNKRKSNFNYTLYNDDKVFIPKKTNIVSIKGDLTGVKDSLVYSYFVKGKRANFYVNKFAGGFTKDIKRTSTRVIYANGSVRKARHYGLFIAYPKLKPGSEIVLYKKVKKDKKGNSVNFNQAVDGMLSKAFIIITILAGIRALQ